MNLLPQVCSVGGAPPHGALSRVAAVGPYVQSIPTSRPLGLPGPDRPETLVKSTYPDGCGPPAAMQDASPQPPPRPAKPAAGERGDAFLPVCAEQEAPPLIPLLFAGFLTSRPGKQSEWGGPCVEAARGSAHASTLPRMSGPGRHSVSEGRSGPGPGPVQVLTADPHLVGGSFLADLAGTDTPPAVPTRTKTPTESLLPDHQVCGDDGRKPASSCGTAALFTPPYSTGTFPGKARPAGGQRRVPGLLQSYTLPLPAKQEVPPAAAVRPYAPDPCDPPPALQKPPTVATSSIYSMYTQQVAPGKAFQLSGQGTLPRRRPRGASSGTGSDPVRTGAFDQAAALLLLSHRLYCVSNSVRETSPPSQRGAASFLVCS